jgi:hypothetical protein
MCETQWGTIISSFDRNYDSLIAGHPDFAEDFALLQTALSTIGQLIHISPSKNGNCSLWKELTANAKAESAVLCKHLDGKALRMAILCMYAALNRELRGLLLPDEQQTEEFREETQVKPLRRASQEIENN